MNKHLKIINLGLVGLFSCCLLSCSSGSKKSTDLSSQQELTDMAGRTISIPKTITKVCSNNFPGTILLYALADSQLVARNKSAGKEERKFCTESYCSLPSIGSWFLTNGTRNTEEIVKLHPDLIVSAGNINAQAVNVSDRDQKLLNIPVALISTDLRNFPQSFRILGKMLNRTVKAKELFDFYNEYIPFIMDKTSLVDSLRRKSVYVAMGSDGLMTSPAGSLHSQVVRYAGGRNVAQINLGDHKIASHTKVEMEQLMKWNPQVILVEGFGDLSSETIRHKILTDKAWSGLDAVKNGEVYAVPTSPYAWIDSPPSVNQIIGLIWLAKKLYPDLFHYDLSNAVKTFYREFYHKSLTDKEVKQLLNE